MTLTTGRPAESTHWYARDGAPMYEVPAANGGLRPTTLHDARKLALVPSVTSIIRCAAAPALENWKVDQSILAALTLPRHAEESEVTWLQRVKRDSQEEAAKAAERGKEIHAAIEAFLTDQPVPVGLMQPCVLVRNMIEDQWGLAKWGLAEWQTELSFAHPLGYGGKADLLNRASEPDTAILLDVKTKERWALGDPLAWDEQAIQLAAYRAGLMCSEGICANVFVSRRAPWQVSLHVWDEDELQRGWRIFAALLDYWKAKNNFDPGWLDDVPF